MFSLPRPSPVTKCTSSSSSSYVPARLHGLVRKSLTTVSASGARPGVRHRVVRDVVEERVAGAQRGRRNRDPGPPLAAGLPSNSDVAGQHELREARAGPGLKWPYGSVTSSGTSKTSWSSAGCRAWSPPGPSPRASSRCCRCCRRDAGGARRAEAAVEHFAGLHRPSRPTRRTHAGTPGATGATCRSGSGRPTASSVFIDVLDVVGGAENAVRAGLVLAAGHGHEALSRRRSSAVPGSSGPRSADRPPSAA